MLQLLILSLVGVPLDVTKDMRYLHSVAHEVVNASLVSKGKSIPNGERNSTGVSLRVPGGTQTFYPAFWVRDAAMMLGSDLVPADEVNGWIRVVSRIQPGGSGLRFSHGLTIPGYSVPDHITLKGEACWFPGAYTDQGVGNYGFLPPADDAFYFIQMANEASRLINTKAVLSAEVNTRWGTHPLGEVCDRAFDSVAVDPATGLVLCNSDPGKTRVDWGFCDSIRKTGMCLMPSLLRWQAARELTNLYAKVGRRKDAGRFLKIAKLIQKSIPTSFFHSVSNREGLLFSATGLGHKDDVWASAFAVWLGILPQNIERKVAIHLLKLYRDGETVKGGQVRSIPKGGAFGGFWEQASSSPNTYQNGGYWATPTGWLVVALRRIDHKAGDSLLHEYCEYVRLNRTSGAPFEWVNPDTHVQTNANYASSAGLVYSSIDAKSR